MFGQWEIKKQSVTFETTAGISKDVADYVIEFDNINLMLLSHDLGYLAGTNNNSLESMGNKATDNPAAFLYANDLLGISELWFFDGYYYKEMPEGFMPAAPSASVTVHISSRQPTYDYGEALTSFIYKYSYDGQEQNLYDGIVLNLNSDESVNILLRSNWWSTKGSLDITHVFLTENPDITDIWIIDGQILTEQPEDWVP